MYGWLANAGLALALWVLGRLAGEPLRAQNWALGGAAFWNLGVTGALVGIAVGDATGLRAPRAPGVRPAAPLLLVRGDRRLGPPRLVRAPARGLLRLALVRGGGPLPLPVDPLDRPRDAFLGARPRGRPGRSSPAGTRSAAWTLWLAPLALSVAYYVVPKVTGKVLPSYEFASLGFWCLIFVGGLTGGRHLVGGPVPAWIASVAVVSCALLLFHTFVVLLNLRGCFAGGGVALRFISFGIAAYVVGAIVDALTSFHAVALHTQFTFFDEAQKQLALYGGGLDDPLRRDLLRAPADNREGLALGGPRPRAPRPLGRRASSSSSAPWPWPRRSRARTSLDPAVAFADIARHTRPWLIAAAAAQAVLLLGNIALTVNFVGDGVPHPECLPGRRRSTPPRRWRRHAP